MSLCRHESSWWRTPRLSMEHCCRPHGLAIFWAAGGGGGGGGGGHGQGGRDGKEGPRAAPRHAHPPSAPASPRRAAPRHAGAAGTRPAPPRPAAGPFPPRACARAASSSSPPPPPARTCGAAAPARWGALCLPTPPPTTPPTAFRQGTGQRALPLDTGGGRPPAWPEAAVHWACRP